MADLRTERRCPDGRLATAWDQLVSADPAATVFQSSAFLRQWFRHLQGACELWLRFIVEGDVLVGVVPEVREQDAEGRRVVHFAGGYHVTDYLGPVSRPEHRDVLVRTWLQALADDEDWDELVAAGLAEDAGWHELIRDVAKDIGLAPNEPRLEGVCPRVDVRGGWDAYLHRITGKQRHEIRRKARKLHRELRDVSVVDVPPADLDAQLDDFFALAAAAGGAKGRFFVDESMRGFFHGLACELGADRTFRLHVLEVRGRPAAMTASLVRDGEWGLYNSAFDHGLARFAPGMVLIAETIRLAGEEGYSFFDLLRGGEEYKYRFGAVDRRVFRLEVAPARSRSRGQLADGVAA